MSDKPVPVIESVLAKLKHLDLSDRLLDEKPELIFRGGYGDVLRGKMLRKDGQGRMEVAMKQLRVSLHNEDFAKSFAKELTIWAKLDHKNIVRLEGFIREDYFLTLVSLWASRGSLMAYINGGNEYNVVQMASGIAEGLAYLHSNDIIHSDLKSENVLIDDLEQPMICDFGISRMLSYSQTILASTSHHKLNGSLRWMSYELLMPQRVSTDMENCSLSTRSSMSSNYTPIHTKASDMWAFGMVIYELISRKIPFSNMRDPDMVRIAIQGRKLPKKPREMRPIEQELWELCSKCWNHFPYARVEIKDAINILKRIPETRPIQIPPFLPRLSAPNEKSLSLPLDSKKESSPMPPKLRTSHILPPPLALRSPLRPTYTKSVASVNSIIDMYTKRDTMATIGTERLEPLPEWKEKPIPLPALYELPAASPSIEPTNHFRSHLSDLYLLNDKPLPDIPNDNSLRNSPAANITLENDTPEMSILSTLTPSSLTVREHALKELLTSERVYASDLASIRIVHIPMALGDSSSLRLPRLFTRSSSASSFTSALSTSSDSLSSTNLDPPMTREDARIIFGNITELAILSEVFLERLQEALGGLLEDGEGADRVGALFLEIIPQIGKPYKSYIIRYPDAIKHLVELPQTPALTHYFAETRKFAPSVTRAWDLQSLLIKPVQRLLSYISFLATITEQTADGHPDKANLRKAWIRMVELAQDANEGRRRIGFVNEILDGRMDVGKGRAFIGKLSLNLIKHPLFGGSRIKSMEAKLRAERLTSDNSEESRLIDMYEKELQVCSTFIRTLASDIIHWVETVRESQEHLREWAIDFGKTVGIDYTKPSETYDAFLETINRCLSPLYQDLHDVVEQELLPQLDVLIDTARVPQRLLSAMHTFEPHFLLHLNHSRYYPSNLEAPQDYLVLRSQLASELPRYLQLLGRGIAMCIRQFASRQTDFWSRARDEWRDLWERFQMEGETNVGCNYTLALWSSRREVENAMNELNILKRDMDLGQHKSTVRPWAAALAGQTCTTSNFLNFTSENPHFPRTPTLCRIPSSSPSTQWQRYDSPLGRNKYRTIHRMLSVESFSDSCDDSLRLRTPESPERYTNRVITSAFPRLSSRLSKITYIPYHLSDDSTATHSQSYAEYGQWSFGNSRQLKSSRV